MKIRSQIIWAQVPTAIIVFFITSFFIASLTIVKYQIENTLFYNFKNIIALQKIKDSVERLNGELLHHPEVFNGKMKGLENKVEQNLIFQEKSIMETAEEKELTASLREKWEFYKKNIRTLFVDNETEELYKEIIKVTTSIAELNQDALFRKKENLLNFITEYRLFIIFSAFVSLLFGFFMSWIFTGLILSPLNKMTQVVSQFGTTDETTLLHIKGSEEIEKLSEEFNLMTKRLEEYHQSSLGHVIENYETLKGALDALPDPFLLFNTQSDIIFMNESALRLFGIGGRLKKKNLLLSLEDRLREMFLDIVKKVILTQKAPISKKAEESLIIYKKNKKTFFFPQVYPVKEGGENIHSKFTGVLIILQDLTHQILSERETGEIYRSFIKSFHAPLEDIQMALYASIQETAGPLTEKQKEFLYAAREKSEELEKLYQDFRKVLG